MLSLRELEDDHPQHASACSNTIVAAPSRPGRLYCADPRNPIPPGKLESRDQTARDDGGAEPWEGKDPPPGRGRGRDPYVDMVAPFVIQGVLVVEGVQGGDRKALCNDCCMAVQGTWARSS